jgi:ATP-dependent DNA helicase RecQ
VQPALDWQEILREARKRFGIRRFRPGQKEILEQVLRGRSVLGLMPTGAGKSLTYQLPAVFLPKPIVVVSPLISLMQDQQEHAAAAEIAVEKIDSTLTRTQAREATDTIDQGAAQLIYVTPERLETPEFLKQLNDAGGISLLVIDEAHCISQWGHDFRPAYLGIGEARKTLGMPPVLALTATATDEVAREILENLRAPDATIVDTGIERTNLHFSVHPTVNTEAKLARVSSLLQQEQGAGIIYTASVRSANELHDRLKERGIPVGHYHGKMPTRERERVQEAFMRGDHRVMIATKAFGLGIDKPDIRFVFHFEFPDSLETYYQEAGRAGRDGLPSRAVLLYRLEDKRIQSYFLAGRYPKIEEMRRVLEAMATPRSLTATPQESVQAVAPHTRANEVLQQPEIGADLINADTIARLSGVGRRRTQVILHLLQDARTIRRSRRGYSLVKKEMPSDDELTQILQVYTDRAQHDKDRLADMMHYAETSGCRVQIIRQYFEDEAGEICGRCDNCDQQAAASQRQANTPLAESQSEQEVTRIETMHGTILTTAPETLPRPEEESHSFRKGHRIRHKRFGEGLVKDTYGDVALVHFLKGGDKKLKISFLTAA